MNPIRPTLKRALCPENIAVIGASDRTASRGSFVWRAVARSKLLKNAWAINPKYKYIGERPCFSSINEVPGSIDLAVISLHADRILKALIDAGERGVAYALITPDENAYASDATWLTKLQLVADQYGMRLIGPDSLGLMNPGLGVNASYWPNLPRPGNIALITQSGKIGTYLKALAAVDNEVPFYVAAPSSTIDWTLNDGKREIPIENRAASELLVVNGVGSDGETRTVQIAAPEVAVANPAFDVTHNRFVTGIITERGIVKPTDLTAVFADLLPKA